ETSRDRGQERGGTTMETEVPWLQRHDAKGNAVADRSAECGPVQGSGSGTAAYRARSVAAAHDRGSEPATAGLDRLLPARAGGHCPGGPRQVAATAAALPAVAAVEAPRHAPA